MFKSKIKNILPPLVTIIMIFIVWFFLSDFSGIPNFMLPDPVSVVKAFISDFPLLWSHAVVTMEEAVIGLIAGTLLGFLIAVLMDRFTLIHKSIYPILVISQTIPSIAIAPLLILWMGFDILPKIVLVAVTSFFPITVSLTQGFSNVDTDEINLFRAMGASKMQIYLNVKIPFTLKDFFGGLKIATTYSVVSAVIAEWLGGFYGLGVYMTRARRAYAFDKMFAVILFITILSLLLILIISITEKALMPWEDKND